MVKEFLEKLEKIEKLVNNKETFRKIEELIYDTLSFLKKRLIQKKEMW